MQSTLNQLAVSERLFGVCISPSKYKVLLHDWLDSVPILTFGSEQLVVVKKLVYPGSCVNVSGVHE